MKLAYDDILTQLTKDLHILANEPKDSRESTKAAQDYNDLLYRYLDMQDLDFITRNAERELSVEEIAKLIVAAANGDSLEDVLNSGKIPSWSIW